MTTEVSEKGYSVYPIVVPVNYNLSSFNFYLYEEGGSLSLIDAGMADEVCWEALNQVMKDNGFTFFDLDRIILTHHHYDHIGLVNRILKVREIPIYAHRKSIPRLQMDKKLMSMRHKFFEQLYREMDCGIIGEQSVGELDAYTNDYNDYKISTNILPLVESDIIAGLRVIETPGHSPDHIVLLNEKNKWLFGGDFLLQHISSNALIEPDCESNRLMTLVQNVNSFEKVLKLDVDIVFSGHQDFIYNTKELIEIRLKEIDGKSNRLKDLIKTGISTANQLAMAYYKDKYQSEFTLVISEIIGHLDYLENNNDLRKEMKDGIWHYSLV